MGFVHCGLVSALKKEILDAKRFVVIFNPTDVIIYRPWVVGRMRTRGDKRSAYILLIFCMLYILL